MIHFWQIDDKSKLEYEGCGKEDEHQQPQQNEEGDKAENEADLERQNDKPGEDKINDDTEEKYEDCQFAQPKVRQLHLACIQIINGCSPSHRTKHIIFLSRGLAWIITPSWS